MSEKSRQSGGNFLVQGSILAAAGIIVRLIGLLYKIPMTRILGDEGIGYYNTAYEIYNIGLILSSYSLPLAVSKLIAKKEQEREQGDANRVFHCGIAVRALPVFVELKPPAGPGGCRGGSGGQCGFLFCKMFFQEGGAGPQRPGQDQEEQAAGGAAYLFQIRSFHRYFPVQIVIKIYVSDRCKITACVVEIYRKFWYYR